MTQVIIAGPTDKETDDDYFMRVFYDYCKGDDEQKGIAGFLILTEALEEMDEWIRQGSSEENPFNEEGWRKERKVYNLAESVHKDLELVPYGFAPFYPNILPILDRFSVVGKLDGVYTGFGIDFFTKDKRNTRVVAFTESESEEFIRRAARESLGFKNVDGDPAYTEKSMRRDTVDLRQYAGEGTIDALVSEGEVVFGGKGISYQDIAKEFMKLVESSKAFAPEKYVIDYYDIQVEPSCYRDKQIANTIEAAKKGWELFARKAERYAA